MTIGQNLEFPRDAGTEQERGTPTPPPTGRERALTRRRIVAGAAVVVACGAVATVAGLAARPDHPETAQSSASTSVPGRPDDPSKDPSRGTRTRKIGSLDVRTDEYGNLATTRRTLRVVSARGDLTGRLELGWVTDDTTAVGDARCTQTYRFGPKLPVGKRPTMLLCWRTSPERSVYTLLVDLATAPSTQASVAVLDRVWDSLG